MAVNKVEYGDTTLIDLTSDTVTKETLLIGATAHTASGESISGEFDPEIYLRKSGGDTTNNIVTFTSGDSTSPTAWTDVNSLVTGEKHSSLLNKISTMIKNVRFLYKVLGTTDISTIGDGTVTGAVSTLNSSFSNFKTWKKLLVFGGGDKDIKSLNLTNYTELCITLDYEYNSSNNGFCSKTFAIETLPTTMKIADIDSFYENANNNFLFTCKLSKSQYQTYGLIKNGSNISGTIIIYAR